MCSSLTVIFVAKGGEGGEGGTQLHHDRLVAWLSAEDVQAQNRESWKIDRVVTAGVCSSSCS